VPTAAPTQLSKLHTMIRSPSPAPVADWSRGFLRTSYSILSGHVGCTGRLEPVSVGHRTGLCSRRQFLPGKSLARPETGLGFSGTTAYFGSTETACPASPSPKPREVKDNSTGARKPDLRGTAWWRTHSTATGLHPEFPDNREINREFFDFGPFSAILIPNRQVNSGGYNKIPYATEQGIFSAEQGIFLREQGISAGQQGSGIGEPISSGRKHPGTGMRRQVSAWFSTKALPGMARPIAA